MIVVMDLRSFRIVVRDRHSDVEFNVLTLSVAEASRDLALFAINILLHVDKTTALHLLDEDVRDVVETRVGFAVGEFGSFTEELLDTSYQTLTRAGTHWIEHCAFGDGDEVLCSSVLCTRFGL